MVVQRSNRNSRLNIASIAYYSNELVLEKTVKQEIPSLYIAAYMAVLLLPKYPEKALLSAEGNTDVALCFFCLLHFCYHRIANAKLERRQHETFHNARHENSLETSIKIFKSADSTTIPHFLSRFVVEFDFERVSEVEACLIVPKYFEAYIAW